MFDGSLDHMTTNEIAPMSWSSLGSVFKKDTEQTQRIIRLLSVFSKKYEATADQLLLAWLLKHPAKIRPVIGTATPERIALAAKSVDIDLELEDWFMLLEAAEGHPVA
jgi:predicted oxidoreductase